MTPNEQRLIRLNCGGQCFSAHRLEVITLNPREHKKRTHPTWLLGWLLELNKFRAGHIETEQQRWLKFFKEGEGLNDNVLPDWMNTQEMQQAMTTLSAFSEKEQQYFQYQARQEYLREQKAIQYELEQRAKLLEQKSLELNQKNQQLNQKSQQLEQKSQQLEQTTQQLLNEQQLKELEKQRADAEKQRADSALAEIQRLKALLDAKKS